MRGRLSALDLINFLGRKNISMLKRLFGTPFTVIPVSMCLLQLDLNQKKLKQSSSSWVSRNRKFPLPTLPHPDHKLPVVCFHTKNLQSDKYLFGISFYKSLLRGLKIIWAGWVCQLPWFLTLQNDFRFYISTFKEFFSWLKNSQICFSK